VHAFDEHAEARSEKEAALRSQVHSPAPARGHQTRENAVACVVLEADLGGSCQVRQVWCSDVSARHTRATSAVLLGPRGTCRAVRTHPVCLPMAQQVRGGVYTCRYWVDRLESISRAEAGAWSYFWVYENLRAHGPQNAQGPQSRVHKGECRYCNNGTGFSGAETSADSDTWHGPFMSRREANDTARALPGPIHHCRMCSPGSH
jgi:hypothetical protein